MSWLEYIVHWDQMAFLVIHIGWTNVFFDWLMPILRNPYTWIPIYVFLLYFSVKKFGMQGVFWCVAFIVVFGLCDFTSAQVIKKMVGRLRPCNDALIIPHIRALVHCGSGFSFPSAHSSNHFGLSFFIIMTLGKTFPWLNIPALFWAFVVVLAQVYVGVHYPLDILAGALLGFIMAKLVSYIFNRFTPLTLNTRK